MISRRWLRDGLALGFLTQRLPWEQHHMPAGQAMPRLECWFSTKPQTYGYSGVVYRSHALTPSLSLLLDRVNDAWPSLEANAVFANLYRDGRDSLGWHADDERSLGPSAAVAIASLSLGASRRFSLRHNETRTVVDYDLGGGDLLTMGPGCQSEWMHCLRKTARAVGPRINLTFRRIV